MMIEVLTAGIFTSIQDNGRYGYRDIGVPVSGCMDQYSSFVANSLVGNNKQAAVLEMVIKGPHLKFYENATIAVVGAPIKIQLNDESIYQNTVISISKGDILSLGIISQGIRCYLAITGGFNSEMILNSLSFYPEITPQSHLNKGDLLNFKSTDQSEIINRCIVQLDEQHFSNNVLSVYPGPEFHTLSAAIKAKIFRKRFKVSPSSNRMAYKFELPITISVDDPVKEILTSSVQPGTVQLTPSGEIIVLMRDCQTTGGYARIFQLTEQSINQLSQKTTASEILFFLIS